MQQRRFFILLRVAVRDHQPPACPAHTKQPESFHVSCDTRVQTVSCVVSFGAGRVGSAPPHFGRATEGRRGITSGLTWLTSGLRSDGREVERSKLDRAIPFQTRAVPYSKPLTT